MSWKRKLRRIVLLVLGIIWYWPGWIARDFMIGYREARRRRGGSS